MGAIAIISAYSCRINNYNISFGDKMVYFAANEHFEYYKDLTSQIGRSSAPRLCIALRIHLFDRYSLPHNF